MTASRLGLASIGVSFWSIGRQTDRVLALASSGERNEFIQTGISDNNPNEEESKRLVGQDPYGQVSMQVLKRTRAA